jgi:hypothetical protein
MGLLDDAIRDHLDLKRRRGADPTEIAREEREALEPVFPDEPRPPGFDDEPQAASLLDSEPPQGDPLHDAAAQAAADPVAAQTFGDETAEIDMQAVMEQDTAEPEAEPDGPPAAEAAGHAGEAMGEHAAHAQPVHAEPVHAPTAGDDDLLEWETPGREGAEPPPEPLPGQESMSFE